MQPKLILFAKPTCPYSARVRQILQSLSLPFTEKNIRDDMVAAELVRRGGKRQIPYLADETTGIEMYESEDILKYLMKKYGGGKELAIEKPAANNVCIPEELLS